jgi:hypothetical protein
MQHLGQCKISDVASLPCHKSGILDTLHSGTDPLASRGKARRFNCAGIHHRHTLHHAAGVVRHADKVDRRALFLGGNSGGRGLMLGGCDLIEGIFIATLSRSPRPSKLGPVVA